MIDRFPYGKAPFWLSAMALISLVAVTSTRQWRAANKPDLVFALSAYNHMIAYDAFKTRFEREHGVKVTLQLVNSRSLTTRLENAILAKSEVPDLVELPGDSMMFLARGPLEDIGLVDLTERLSLEHYRERLVESRVSLWSSRGHVFAIPHDVHPVMLMYRADLVEALGIDVAKLQTWDDFVRVGRSITRDLDGDGVNDRYMIDLPTGGGQGISITMLQRGVGLFDESGHIAFNKPAMVDTLIWYAEQTYGPTRIAFDCGWGQSLAKAMTDGLVLFYFAPDWRTLLMSVESPSLAGKMKLMPLPAWELGGRRTSVWGGSGLAITKQSPQQDLAWQFARELYFTPAELGKRFAMTNIIAPFRDAWHLPELERPNAYFSGQPIGALYAELAPDTPPVWFSPYSTLAENKLNEAFLRAARYYEAHGHQGLHDFVQHELDDAEAYLDRAMSRNVLTR